MPTGIAVEVDPETPINMALFPMFLHGGMAFIEIPKPPQNTSVDGTFEQISSRPPRIGTDVVKTVADATILKQDVTSEWSPALDSLSSRKTGMFESEKKEGSIFVLLNIGTCCFFFFCACTRVQGVVITLVFINQVVSVRANTMLSHPSNPWKASNRIFPVLWLAK